MIRPLTSKRPDIERKTNKPEAAPEFEDMRPETVFRFVFQDEVNASKQQAPLRSPQELRQDEEQAAEKKRIKEAQRENKR